ncbi:hypothetical protein HF1_12940 [Mycoplasma haemofelis str. Langford 1]|uniref:Uncharacterized protein n=1 Tax=Mycoplasma haemofelis (strain Langford 1) TaxID=941640 RepID=E8ZJI1_MYCHL|nr:hypothetical protein [Mycoplasma haemofelis]CBY93302.1 hypothetical protein HF1_12940 [Mycoplasma haemofelis str. Langford 1]
MALSEVTKVATGLGLAGATVGGGFLAKSLISQESPKQTISDKLKRNQFTPLNTDVSRTEASGSAWQTIFTKYKELTKQKEEFKIKNLTLGDSENQNEGINKLKGACSSLLKIEEDSDSFKNNYPLASKWCVEPISIEALLKKRGISYLDTTSQDNTGTWTNIAKRYSTDHTSQKGTTMSDVQWEQVTSDDYSTNAGKIKTACNTRKTKNSYEEDFEKSLEEAQRWCSSSKDNEGV